MKLSRPLSTYEREIQDPVFKEQFEEEYQQFALSEIILQLMEEDHISVRQLAKAAGISPTVIQDIRSGKRRNITVYNLSKILKALGSRIAVQIGEKYVPLGG
jgi:DNA-binding Xre family transcriptional regulator